MKIVLTKNQWNKLGKKAQSAATLEPNKWEKELMGYSEQVANDLCKNINQIVPKSVEGMPYARQWVLEEAIKILQERVQNHKG